MADPKHPGKFSEEFKRQVAQLHDNGKPAGGIKAERGIGGSTLHRWVRAIRESGSTRAAGNRTPGRQRALESGKEDERPGAEADVLRTAAPASARKRPR